MFTQLNSTQGQPTNYDYRKNKEIFQMVFSVFLGFFSLFLLHLSIFLWWGIVTRYIVRIIVLIFIAISTTFQPWYVLEFQTEPFVYQR